MVSNTGIFADATYSLLEGVVIVTWGSTLSIQVYRYMRVYTYSERQQTKWLIFGLASGLLLTAASTILSHLLPQLSRPDSPYQLLVVAQTELNYSIQARTGSHWRTCCSPSLAAAAAL